MFKLIVELFLACATLIWLVLTWFRTRHKPTDKRQNKCKQTFMNSLRVIILMSLANPGNSFIVMSREGVGVQSCDSSINKHSVTSSRGRVYQCSINYQSGAPSNLRSMTLGNTHATKFRYMEELGLYKEYKEHIRNHVKASTSCFT